MSARAMTVEEYIQNGMLSDTFVKKQSPPRIVFQTRAMHAAGVAPLTGYIIGVQPLTSWITYHYELTVRVLIAGKYLDMTLHDDDTLFPISMLPFYPPRRFMGAWWLRRKRKGPTYAS